MVQPVNVRSKPNNTVAESVMWPHEGEGQRTPGDPFTSDSIISVASHLPLLPPGIERACTRYTGGWTRRKIPECCCIYWHHIRNTRRGSRRVSYLAIYLRTKQIPRGEGVEMVTAAARARAHVPPARINHGISTLLGHTARYARIMGAYTCVSPDSRVPDAVDAEQIACRPRNGDLRSLFKSLGSPLSVRWRRELALQRPYCRYDVTYRTNRDNRPRRDREYARRRQFATVSLYAFADSRWLRGEREKIMMQKAAGTLIRKRSKTHATGLR